jgi:hypothetical protein
MFTMGYEKTFLSELLFPRGHFEDDLLCSERTLQHHEDGQCSEPAISRLVLNAVLIRVVTCCWLPLLVQGYVRDSFQWLKNGARIT